MAHITSWIPTEPGAESAAGMAREPHGTQRRKGCRKHDRIGRRIRSKKNQKNNFGKFEIKSKQLRTSGFTTPTERCRNYEKMLT